jgi:Flp pilus assembly protein TadD
MLWRTLAFLVPPLLVAQTPEAGLIKARESVVMIKAEIGLGMMQVGSGVVLAPGLIATNAHVLRNALSILIIKDGRVWEARSLCLASDRDLVLLRVPGLPLPPAQVAAPDRMQAGMPVVALGFPGGHGPKVTRGHLAALWNYRGDRLLQADAEIRPGSSGGGLFTEDGLLLGITTFVFQTSHQLSFSVPASWVLGLLDRPQAQELVCPAMVGEGLLRDFGELIIDDPANRDQWEALTRSWVREAPADAEAWFASGMAVDRRLRESQPDEGAPLRERAAAVAKVMDAYGQAVALDGGHAKAWNNLGVAYDEQNRFAEAEAAFHRAVAARPDYGLAWLNLGNTLLNAGRHPDAVQAYGRGLALVPDEAQGWARLAYCEGYLLRWRDAARHYQLALAYSPFRADWWAEAFKACILSGNPTGAQAALERLEPLSVDLARTMKAWAKGRR